MGTPSNPAAPIQRFLAASARRGSTLLALGIGLGIAAPPLAATLHELIAPDVVLMMTLVLLRVDVPGTLAQLRRPLRVAGVAGFLLLACPALAWAAVTPLGLDRGIADGVVIFATGCAAMSAPAFARMLGLDPELSLVGTLTTTLLVPVTAPPMALWLLGIDLSISAGAFAARLGLIVGAPLLVSLALRRLAGPARLAEWGAAADGLLVWAMVVYGIAVMDGLAAQAARDPAWVAQALAAAFAADYGLSLATTAAFAGLGRRAAASVGVMSGNRNMALYLAVLPAAADSRLALFFGLCQVPLFLSPFLLRPAVRRWLAQPNHKNL